jgi:hypothetical protein
VVPTVRNDNLVTMESKLQCISFSELADTSFRGRSGRIEEVDRKLSRKQFYLPCLDKENCFGPYDMVKRSIFNRNFNVLVLVHERIHHSAKEAEALKKCIVRYRENNDSVVVVTRKIVS